MKPNSTSIATLTLIAFMWMFSHSRALAQEISHFKTPWEVQNHLKYLNEYKLFSELESFLKSNYSDASLNLETRLYITDDLANLYATKLINFKKADEFNKIALGLYSSIIVSDLT
ncbi:MAG: hypothetical protein HOJ14_05230, partial [Nitrospina sp.]|nr:hypothetical protein [Nitrospina sp.]